MKVTEALKIIQSAPANARPFSVVLACGFTPLHLQTFLSAHLQQSLPDRKVVVTPGLYGNLAQTLEGNQDPVIDGIAIALEWSDLDARLDFRSAGSWGRSAAPDIVANAQAMLNRLAAAIGRVPSGVRVALSLPTLRCRRYSTHRDGRLPNTNCISKVKYFALQRVSRNQGG